MEKIGFKGIKYALQPLFLLQLSSLVVAVDLQLFGGPGCDGFFLVCANVAPVTCCQSDLFAESAGIADAGSCITSQIYTDLGCTTQIDEGIGNHCSTGQRYSGVFWFSTCPSRRLLSGEFESQISSCTTQVKPNAIHFIEDGMRGKWVLTSTNSTQLFSILSNVEDAEKLNWLISQGATYTEL